MKPRARGLLGSLEELVLLSLAHCGADAYGMLVRAAPFWSTRATTCPSGRSTRPWTEWSTRGS